MFCVRSVFASYSFPVIFVSIFISGVCVFVSASAKIYENKCGSTQFRPFLRKFICVLVCRSLSYISARALDTYLSYQESSWFDKSHSPHVREIRCCLHHNLPLGVTNEGCDYDQHHMHTRDTSSYPGSGHYGGVKPYSCLSG